MTFDTHMGPIIVTETNHIKLFETSTKYWESLDLNIAPYNPTTPNKIMILDN